jgi:type VI secretion system protein ImpA
VFAVEELLQPIDDVQISGMDLRYDPLIDTIQEARSEEDDSLPMGDWVRQTKRADYPLVSTLTRSALLKGSKDLWLAVWLGEATLKLDGYEALEPVLSLLSELQKRFWPNLYPAIEEGDLSLRSAPLHWALSRYTKLLQELPVAGDGIGYGIYRAVRSGNAPNAQDEDALTARMLDAAVAATPKAFYSEVSSTLGRTHILLEELYLLCEENYGEDGPSFVSFRTALEELQNLFSQLLRLKQVQEPDPEPPAPLPPPVEAEPVPASYAPAQEETAAPMPIPALVATPAPAQQRTSTSEAIGLHSWVEVMEHIARCADFVVEQQPAHPTAYLLTLALQYGRESFEEDAPSSEMRVKLKKASEAGDWNALLTNALEALRESSGKHWLDLYRYIWQASQALDADALTSLVVIETRVLHENNTAVAEELFGDDTPVANPETRRWLTSEVFPPELLSPEPEPAAELHPIVPAIQTHEPNSDPYAEAQDLASRGELIPAVRFLLTQDTTKRGARTDFLRRTQVCRLLMESGRNEAAVPILRQLLAEMDEKHLESWEEPQVLSEVLSLLLQALATAADANSMREAIFARLCQIDPAIALTLQPIS